MRNRPIVRSASRVLGLALACALALPAAALQETTDTVTLAGGEARSGTVEAEDHAGLTLKSDGKTSTIGWDEVQSIEYGDAPDLVTALTALSGGRLEEAKGALELVASAEKLRPVLRQQVLFHTGWIEQRLGNLDAAIAAYQQLLDAFPTGRYLRPGAENLAACQLAKGDAGAAQAALEKAEKDAGDAAPQIQLVKARIQESSGNAAGAKTIYESLQGSALPAVAQEARLGIARLLIEDGKKAEAEKILKEVVAEKAPPLVQSGAWNGLGDLFSEEGFAKRDSEKLLDGLYSYLRGVVQYKPLLGEPTTEYERALAGAARCFRYISELEQNAERKRLFANRAQQHLQRLKNEYPQSIYLEDT
jgi:tetratricopeptide (TPR) repeat protein